MTNNTCDNCDFKPVIKDYHFTFGQRKTPVTVPALSFGECATCGETSIDAAACERIDRSIREKPEAREQIRTRRKRVVNPFDAGMV